MLRSYRKLVLQKMYDGLNFNHKEGNSLLLVIREHERMRGATNTD